METTETNVFKILHDNLELNKVLAHWLLNLVDPEKKHPPKGEDAIFCKKDDG